jgi:hypothetical protein
VFYRDWAGPEGEDVHGDILEECKLRKDLGFGALMAVILAHEPSARREHPRIPSANVTSPLVSLNFPTSVSGIFEGIRIVSRLRRDGRSRRALTPPRPLPR